MSFRRRSRAALAGLVASALLGSSTTLAAPAGAADPAVPGPTVIDVASERLAYADDDGGCGVNDRWELCVYYQHGAATFARVVPDVSDEAGRDGSLRLATPNADDRLLLTYHGHDDGREFPRFVDLDSASVSMRVVSGNAPAFSLKLACEPHAPYGGDVAAIRFAGAYPAADEGWATIDLVQGGEAPWSDGNGVVRPLDEWQAGCADGLIRGHDLFLDTAGSDARVDMLTLGHRTVNFWVPPLRRVDGAFFRGKLPPVTVAQRMRAAEVASRQYVTGYEAYNDDDWPYPARRRTLSRARAVVIAPQKSPELVLVAGALADAVRGPLLVNPPDRLRVYVRWAQKVFLVGNRKQLSPRVARDLRESRHDVVRIGGTSRYATASKVAKLIERRRGEVPSALVLADGRRLHDSLAASAAAAASRGAVLLTRGRSLPRVTRRYLADRSEATVYAVGKAASIAHPGLPAGRQVFGANRYVTAVKVARKFFPEPTSTVFASGTDYVDALIAASYSGHEGHPLLLLRARSVPGAVEKYLRAHHGELEDSLLVGDARGIGVAAYDQVFKLLDRG